MSDELLPAATVVLLRDADRGPELLLLQRSPRKGKPGPWVFPGGKVDPADRVPGVDDAERPLARNELLLVLRCADDVVAMTTIYLMCFASKT